MSTNLKDTLKVQPQVMMGMMAHITANVGEQLGAPTEMTEGMHALGTQLLTGSAPIEAPAAAAQEQAPAKAPAAGSPRLGDTVFYYPRADNKDFKGTAPYPAVVLDKEKDGKLVLWAWFKVGGGEPGTRVFSVPQGTANHAWGPQE